MGAGWAGLPAHRRLAPAPGRSDHLVLLAVGQPVGGAQRLAGGGVRHHRSRLHGRPLAVPAVRRPQRGARGAGPHPGARRHRRPPARLGAADPGADPAPAATRRPCPASPGRRSATCAPGCTTSNGEGPATVAAELREFGRRGRGRLRRRRRGGLVGDGRHRRGPARSCRGARGDPQRRQARRAPAPSTSTSRSHPPSGGVRARPRRGLRPRPGADDRLGVRAASSDRMERHGGTRRCGAARVRHRGAAVAAASPPGHQDRPQGAHMSPRTCRDRRRPRHVPHRRPRRARTCGRRGRRGGGRRPGRGRGARAPAGRRAARRAPSRRRRRRGDAPCRAARDGGRRHHASWRCRSRTPPRT